VISEALTIPLWGTVARGYYESIEGRRKAALAALAALVERVEVAEREREEQTALAEVRAVSRRMYREERDRLRDALQRIADSDLPHLLHPAGTDFLAGCKVAVQFDYGLLSASTFARDALRVTVQETKP
jgi:hypothetical protein